MNPLYSLLLAIGLLGGGYWWGDHAATNSFEAAKGRQAVQANADLVRESGVANQAATDARAEETRLRARYRTLEGAFRELNKTTPLLAAATACEPSSPGTAQAPQPAGGDPAELSLGAVWMWNSALAGADAPAGACGAADTTHSACASQAGVDLADAWANHAVNAQSCAEDRSRYQRLIDYLRQRQTQPLPEAAP